MNSVLPLALQSLAGCHELHLHAQHCDCPRSCGDASAAPARGRGNVCVHAMMLLVCPSLGRDTGVPTGTGIEEYIGDDVGASAATITDARGAGSCVALAIAPAVSIRFALALCLSRSLPLCLYVD